ncbi:NAD(P)H-quinone oxidoreductase [Oceanibaculum pacificum]|uniref:NAD(P)H-quinone oxidoreductase n=1 Tax=Oceanibaculum pacificum TaxID=580166 RepID=A0A154VGY3_9PROT|nr:NAD(P)H-quinone oxidoreductase [Oceanibaculum pacificum]KZD00606.1 NAD(P)H-quinone oxidoreductase [Oceanibaculum pacificum]
MALPETMRAIEIAQPGGPEVLRSGARPVPQPKPGEVLIKVEAAGVNRPDVQQRKGSYNPPPGTTDIPGLEVAGTIVAIGEADPMATLEGLYPNPLSWKVGDKVCALVAGGGYAEYCTAPILQCLPVPEGYSMAEAAGLPETFFTVWTNVFERGRLMPGEVLLVHGGSSGIGTTAIQLAKQFGARVFATAGSDEKCKICEELGAERGINYKTEDFAQVLKESCGGADVILDMVGAPYLEKNLDALRTEGRLVIIAVLGGAKTEMFIPTLMMKRLTVTASTLRPRSVMQKALIGRDLYHKVWPLLAKREVRPLIHKIFPLDQAAEAHALMESSTHIGKIMLET